MKYAKHIMFAAFALALLFAVAPASEAGPKGTTIVDIVLSNPDVTGDGEGDFDTLLAAVLASDPAVLATLGGNGQHTVFAPTDDAFAKLGLDEDKISDVTAILLYHVANGRRDSEDVVSSSQIRMINKQFADITVDGGAFINDAEIIVVDVAAANGIVHVIDSVLLPQ